MTHASFRDAASDTSSLRFAASNRIPAPGWRGEIGARIAEDLENGGHQVTRFCENGRLAQTRPARRSFDKPCCSGTIPGVLEELRRAHEARAR
jgi:hypothetical protein